MNEMLQLLLPYIGTLVGVALGAFLNEFIRRGRRVEQYSSVIFEKRLEVYERLMGLMQSGYELATEAMDADELSAEDRKGLVSTAILSIAQFTDENVLYLDGELGAHCVALFMGAEDIHDMPDEEGQPAKLRLMRQYADTKRMIVEDSGVAEVNKLFKTINKPKITSPVIERIRELRRQLPGQ